MNFAHLLGQHLTQGFKKLCYDLLVDRYFKHEETVEQVARLITCDKDYERFGKLLMEFYDAGYVKAVEDHQRELQKLGLKIVVKRPEATEPEKKNPIF